MKLSIIIVLLSVIISVFSVQASVPLRGTSRDDETNSSTTTAAPKKLVVRSTGEGTPAAASGATNTPAGAAASGTTPTTPAGAQNGAGAQGAAAQGAAGAQGSESGQIEATQASGADTKSDSAGSSDSTSDSTQTVDPMESCGVSFVMWYVSGVPVTTLACGPYTIVYASVDGDKNPGPKYVSGTVSTVTVDTASGTNTLKINGQDFATLSADSSSPTTASGAATTPSARLLQDASSSTAAVQMTDIYSFTLKGGKEISVGIPVDSSNQKQYSLSADNETFYTGANSGSTDGLFKLNEDGDLVDSKNQVVLKDADSSAFGFRYIVPSVFAVFAAFFML